ncbi:MAG: DUF2304 domain-containing protein [Lachnospiraceae bacterium]|nr:DUF2304 domain-containing protein [Lachnospiraceae bacterium]
MRDGLLIQAMLIVFGASMFITAFVSLVRRKMSEVVVIPWGLGSVIFIILGLVIRPDGWKGYLSTSGLILTSVICICGAYAIYFFSIRITETMKKNNELAIQVSLLNTEVEELRKKMEILEEENFVKEGSGHEENSVRN